MFGFEKHLTLFWLCGCYSVFAAALMTASSFAEPEVMEPLAGFEASHFDGCCSLANEPVSTSGIVAIPVQLRNPSPTAYRIGVRADGPLPDYVQFVNAAQQVEFAPAQTSASVWLNVNWRLVREPVPLTLVLDYPVQPNAAPDVQRRCNVVLHPLPVVSGSLDGESFQEGRQQAITATFRNAHPFPQPFRFTTELLCERALLDCLPTRTAEVQFPAGADEVQITFPVPDNRIATGDRPLRLTARSDNRRVVVHAARSDFLYNDDERVYNVALETVGGDEINEDDSSDRVRKLRVTLNEPCGPKGLNIPLKVVSQAEQGVDYDLSASGFQFSSGEQEATITLTVHDDNLREGREPITLSMTAGDEIRFVGASTSQFVIIDSDALLVQAAISSLPISLTEGQAENPVELTFTVAPGQVSLNNWSDKQRAIHIRFVPSGSANRRSTDVLEAFDAEGQILPKQLLALDPSGVTRVTLRAKDDSTYQGLQVGHIQCDSQDYVNVQQQEPWVTYVEDNDRFPAKIRIEGKQISDRNNLPESYWGSYYVSEEDLSLEAKLTIELDEPAERDLLLGLKVSGKAEEKDVRLGPSPYLAAGNIQRFGLEMLTIPRGTRTLSLPIKALDDAIFEGPESLSFDLVPSLQGGKAKMYVLDDDPVLTGFPEDPLFLSEGQVANLRIEQKNAPDGLLFAVPVRLSIVGEENNEGRLRLKTLNAVIEPRKRYVDVPLAAIADSKQQGREAYKIEVVTPGYETSKYRNDPPLTVFVDDEGFQLRQVIVVVLTPAMRKNWEVVREGMIRTFSGADAVRLNSGVLLIGDEGTSELYKLDRAEPTLKPIVNSSPDEVFATIDQQLQSQIPKGFASQVEALVFWDVSDNPQQLPTEAIRFPAADKIKVSLLLYGTTDDAAEVAKLQKVAAKQNRSNQQHRVATQPDSRLLPAHLNHVVPGRK